MKQSKPLKSHYPKQQLTWVERIAIRIGERLNQPGILRRISVWWGKVFTCAVLHKITGHRWVHIHTERLEQVSEQAPILVVSNHRTFFDMYVGITALRYLSLYKLGAPAVFPVRSPFFYDHPLGIILNLIASGGCMWPPVFRDDRRSVLNPISTEKMKELLKQDGVCFGFHPEGRRSKSPDIYTLEPPKKGVGQLINSANDRLIIIPLFMSGLSGNAKQEWRLRKQEFAQSHPLKFYWGQPRLAKNYQGSEIEIAQQVHQEIQDLANEARLAETSH